MLNAERIKLVWRFGAVVTNDELEEEIYNCQEIINSSKNSSSNSLNTKAINALKILIKERDKRWWNRVEIFYDVSEEDKKYIKYLLENRYALARKVEGMDLDEIDAPKSVIERKKITASGQFSGFDRALEIFREAKGYNF